MKYLGRVTQKYGSFQREFLHRNQGHVELLGAM